MNDFNFNNKYIIVPIVFLLYSYYGVATKDAIKYLDCELEFRKFFDEYKLNPANTFADCIRGAIEKTVKYIADKYALIPLNEPNCVYDEEKLKKMKEIQKELIDYGYILDLTQIIHFK